MAMQNIVSSTPTAFEPFFRKYNVEVAIYYINTIKIGICLKKNNLNGDRELENEGWIKIHEDEVYGCFIGELKPSSDFPYAYCPTEIQVKMICDYIDKYHNGKLYTRPKIVETTDAISTYKLRKMDKVMLHKLFGLG